MNIIDLHRETWERLSARRSQLPHALLLSGQRGIGKFELARCFAESLLCEDRTASGEACGSCCACGWLAQSNHPDFRLLQPDALGDEESESEEGGRKKASQQITIAQVRGLDDFLHVGTHRHGARVVLINPAEAMNRSTANSLLKSLEEPIASTLFLLVSNEPDRLLPTIRSRCQSVSVPQPAAALAVEWLRQSGVDDAERWLALAGGSPLLAVELGGSDERTLLDALVAQMSRGKGFDPIAAAAAVDKVLKAEKGSAPLKRLVEWSQKWLFDLLLVSEGLPLRYFVTQAALLQRLAHSVDDRKLLAFNRKALQYKAQCEQPLNSRLFLEEFFLSYAALFRTS
ncbi:MAG: DNA polymerase III subunit delta' [Rhodocyclaceae bacterium]